VLDAICLVFNEGVASWAWLTRPLRRGATGPGGSCSVQAVFARRCGPRHRSLRFAVYIATSSCGMSRRAMGSTLKPRLSSAVAPNRWLSPGSATTTVTLASLPFTRTTAPAVSRSMVRPSATMNERRRKRGTPTWFSTSRGTQVRVAPVSTRSSTSATRVGSAGCITATCTENCPITFLDCYFTPVLTVSYAIPRSPLTPLEEQLRGLPGGIRHQVPL